MAGAQIMCTKLVINHLKFARISTSCILCKKPANEILGIPPKPKRPINGYFAYTLGIRKRLIKEQPNAPYKEILRQATAEWYAASPEIKTKLSEEYKADMIKYQKAYKEYVKNLCPETKDNYEQDALNLRIAREKKVVLKKRAELGCPKMPTTPFINFFRDQGESVEYDNYRLYMKELSKKWKMLDKSKKQVYTDKYRKEIAEYRVQYKQWAAESKQKGHEDVDIKIAAEPVELEREALRVLEKEGRVEEKIDVKADPPKMANESNNNISSDNQKIPENIITLISLIALLSVGIAIIR